MIKTLKSTMIFHLIILINIAAFLLAMPTVDNSQEENETKVLEEVLVTAFPDTQKRFVDLNYVSPEVSNLLQRSNLNIQQIREQQEKLKNSDRNRFDSVLSSTEPTTYQTSRELIESERLNVIKKTLEATLRQPDTDENDDDDNFSSSKPQFDYAFPPVCDMPRNMPIDDWFGTKSWNILFKPSYAQFNIKNVMLRIFKVARNNTDPDCSIEVDQMLSLTVSVYIKKNRSFRKKMIYSTMIERNLNGWIEIDAIGTLKYWQKPRFNYGLAIDVYDIEEKQLDAREFFQLQICEAGPILPWGSFQLLANQNNDRGTNAGSGTESMLKNVYTGPRLDITSTKPASYNRVSSTSSEDHERQQRHAHHSNHHHSRRNHHKSHFDNSEAILSNKVLNLRSDHLHRDEET